MKRLLTLLAAVMGLAALTACSPVDFWLSEQGGLGVVTAGIGPDNGTNWFRAVALCRNYDTGQYANAYGPWINPSTMQARSDGRWWSVADCFRNGPSEVVDLRVQTS